MTRSTPSGTRRLARLGSVLLVTLVLVTTPALGVTDTPSASIENVMYSGDGDVGVSDTGLLLWHSTPHRFLVAVSTPSDVDAEVCLSANSTGREIACEQAALPANSTESIAVAFDRWPANTTGTEGLDVVLRRANSSDPVDRRSLTVTVLRRAGDFDGDGITNEREVSIGTDPRVVDTDGDGLSDNSEMTTYGSSPVFADSDNDGLSDGAEIGTHRTDPMEADTDGDGLLDSRELELGASPFTPDSDGDGITDAVEVNTYGTNATTADTDADGLDDGAELTTYRTNPMDGDTDGDGISDALEVFTYETAPGDPDTDDDGLPDGAEVTDHRTEPVTADTDADGIDDGREVYRYGTNPLNEDTDGDGLSDGVEVDRYETDPLAFDSDGDGTSDRVEVQTGLFPDVQGPALVVLGVLLTLVATVGGVYWANGRPPGRRAVASIGDGVRTVGRTLTAHRRDHDPEAESHEDVPRAPNVPDGGEDVPPAFLSNEERVLRILDGHDRQVRQSDIVGETDWSKAKVSRVLSNMEEDGTITKIDIGRENVVTRPENAPAGVNSSFEP